MRRLLLIVIIFLLHDFPTFAQDSKLKWFVGGGANVYIPGQGSEKSVFPVLGYNANTSPKLMIGGFQANAFTWQPLAKELHLKIYGSLAKHTYWDAPLYFRDPVGNFNGLYQGWSSDYVLNVGGVVHYDLVSNFSFGAGIGVHSLLFSVSALPDMDTYYGMEVESDVMFNNYYKRVVPVVPVEINYRWKRMMAGFCYDFALINRIRGEMGKDVKEKYGNLRLNVAVRIGK